MTHRSLIASSVHVLISMSVGTVSCEKCLIVPVEEPVCVLDE